ncbi:uncharacterized protein [Cicer arietinum]|uniref:Uncharacterized protein LOC101513627 n=1 Tax=Cicer arietinum TaxID=3827 RepID=A0A1S2YLV1_CICAR|nr:uncharacterized protein LOC101513627 [Cicer arietinum]
MVSQDHQHLSSAVICESILQMVTTDPTISVSVLIAHIRSRYTYTTTYRKTWIAKQKAIERIYDNSEESYKELPRWILAFKHYLPSTVTDIEVGPFIEDDQRVPSKAVFHRLFWSFQPCIRGFDHCKPVVSVDGTWLYGKYRGTLLMAIAQDGDSHTIPIAYAIVEGETSNGWFFFLSRLRIYAMTQPGITYFRRQISDWSQDAVKWLDDIPKEQWLQAYDEGRRWGHMTTNLSECMNNVLKGTRNLPISSFVQATYYRLTAKFEERGTQAQAMMTLGLIYSNTIIQNLNKERAMSNSHEVVIHNRAHSIFTVKELVRPPSGRPVGTFKVDLDKRWCDCGEFQALHYPCSHVIAACSFIHRTSGLIYSNTIIQNLNKERAMSNSHEVVIHNRAHSIFTVKELVRPPSGRPVGTFKVDLDKRWCNCGEFQALHYPCSHVIAACSFIHRDYMMYVSSKYTLQSIFDVYKDEFPTIPLQSY